LDLTKQIKELKKCGLPTDGVENELRVLVDDQEALKRRIVADNKKNFMEETNSPGVVEQKATAGSKFRSNKNWLEYAQKFHPELP